MTIAMFLSLCQIFAAIGAGGVAFITIRKDVEARLAAGTSKPEDPLPPEHLQSVKHRLEHGEAASDALWDETHAPEGG